MFIADVRPRFTPFFDAFLVIPIVIIFFMALILLSALFISSLVNLFAVLVKVVNLAALCRPRSVSGYASSREHNMSVRVSVIFIVQAPIGTHASFGQTADILPNSCYLFGSVQLMRQCHFNFSP